MGDLCDVCKSGDEIELIGVYSNSYDSRLNTNNGFPIFATVIVANQIVRYVNLNLHWPLLIMTCSGMTRRVRLSEWLMTILKPSISFPRMKGLVRVSSPPLPHNDIKRALALSLFWGVSKNPQEKHKVRGDINVLPCSDPGTAKSYFLKYVQKTPPRAVFSTG